MAHDDAAIDDVANELASWPGVRITRGPDSAAVVLADDTELGILYPERRLAELEFPGSERDEVIDEGAAEPTQGTDRVSHDVRGPADVTAVLALFDRRYRAVRGEASPYSTQDPGY
jgi:Family of unknown function (DUF5519)